MSKARLMKGWRLAILAGFFSCLLLIAGGCAKAVKYTLPPLAEKAVPNLTLDDRPTLDLTDPEILLLEKTSPEITGKLLKNQARWSGYADIANAAVQGYRDFIREVFTPQGKERK